MNARAAPGRIEVWRGEPAVRVGTLHFEAHGNRERSAF